MGNKIELIGKKIGRWTILSEDKSTKAGVFYLCQCDCGNQKILLGTSISRGKSRSCGCYHNDSKSKDLTNQKFNMLTCIKSTYILINNKKKRVWECRCDCGKYAAFSATDIIHGRNRSCGCLRIRDHSDILNIKFGNLLPFEAFIKIRSECNHTYYKCRCDCGKIIETQADKLKLGHTSSCGCKRIKSTSKRLTRIVKSRKPEHQLYLWKYAGKGNMSLENFTSIATKNCYYCNSAPILTFNMNNKQFVYNEIDKIDQSLPYNVDNVLPCCRICYRFKRYRSINEFIDHVNLLNFNFPDSQVVNINTVIDYFSQETNKTILSIAKVTYNNIYKDDNITLQQFFNLSKLPCHYCNKICTNSTNRKLVNTTVTFQYNGLDRLDSTKKHSLDNVVPCCKWCNWGKNNMSISHFREWIYKVKQSVNNFDNSRNI